MTLNLYYRESCYLCDEMLLALKQLQNEWQFELIGIDIDCNPALRQAYQTRLPLLK
jgi:thiol-disulfide isomerase/thioredoxin